MTERGMIFNAEMVRAILGGRKTQTRRVLTPRQLKMIDAASSIGECYPLDSGQRHENSQSYYREWCPFGVPGDRIWVRETFATGLCTKTTLAYRATHKREDLEDGWNETIKWTPSIHMPRWASRILLEITGVRVERLNSISQEDAQAEGMELTGWRPTYSDPDSGGEAWTPYDNFAQLWESIYGEGSWQANPWVWVIEFKVVPNVQDNPSR
ncbi:TPA: morphogenetic protein [Citrobacter farmeri]